MAVSLIDPPPTPGLLLDVESLLEQSGPFF